MPELPDVEVFKQYLVATSLQRKIDDVRTAKKAGSVRGVKKRLNLKNVPAGPVIFVRNVNKRKKSDERVSI